MIIKGRCQLHLLPRPLTVPTTCCVSTLTVALFTCVTSYRYLHKIIHDYHFTLNHCPNCKSLQLLSYLITLLCSTWLTGCCICSQQGLCKKVPLCCRIIRRNEGGHQLPNAQEHSTMMPRCLHYMCPTLQGYYANCIQHLA